MEVTWHKMKNETPPGEVVLYVTTQSSYQGRRLMEAVFDPHTKLWFDPDCHEFYYEDDSWYVVAWAHKPEDPEPYMGE